MLIYLFLSFRLVKTYQLSLLNKVSNTERIGLRWVTQFIYVIAASCILILAFLIASLLAGGKYTLQDWDDPRAFALLVYAGVLYWISISGFKQAQTHRMLKLAEPKEEDVREYSEVIQKLNAAIGGQQLYRNPQLSLAQVMLLYLFYLG